jgi:hypothetical protein
LHVENTLCNSTPCAYLSMGADSSVPQSLRHRVPHECNRLRVIYVNENKKFTVQAAETL